MKSLVSKLESWFLANCDGDWEHGRGIRIETLDNPGWSIKIDLEDTEADGREFTRLHLDRTENDWLRCRVEGKYFEAYGGPTNLEEMLEIFLTWVLQT